MFTDFEDYFDCVLSHYGDVGSKVDHICRDTGLTAQVVIDALKKRNIEVKYPFILGESMIIKRGDKYFYNLQIQDDVLHKGPFDSSEQARLAWIEEAKTMNGWKNGDPEPSLYEAVQVITERLVPIGKPKKCCGGCCCGDGHR
jgi:hypothetical protein